jgi:TRAP-type uncharacterized transport system substrate-binding protein/ketosteroid isomerase-like protein
MAITRVSSSPGEGPSEPVPPTLWQSARAGLLRWGLVAVIALAALVAAYFLLVEPPPPRQLRIAAGSTEGAYFAVANRYAEELRKDGITLDVVVTEGSLENLRLLGDDSSNVSMALVQSGLASDEERAEFVSLGSIYREPLWIFYRGAEPITVLGQLAGKRIAVGPEASGTHRAAVELIAANGVTLAGQAGGVPGVDYSKLGGDAAAVALVRDEVDAAVFVASIDAPYVRTLLSAEGVRLVDLAQQAAYAHRYRHLSPVTLPRGLVDLGRDIPAADVRLVAPAATLVVRKDFHPAFVSLLLDVAKRVNASGDVLSTYGEFPSPAFTDIPVSDDARRFYEFGPPVLQRHLPFWLASLIDRAKYLLIPIIVLLMPLARLAPPVVVWSTRRKIFRWYRLVREIDLRTASDMSSGEAREKLAKLAEIENQVAQQVKVPLAYMEEFFNLREHVAFVRERLEAVTGADASNGAPLGRHSLTWFLERRRSAVQPYSIEVSSQKEHTTKDENVEAIRTLYEAFGRGDIPTVMAALMPDVAWTEADGFPYGGTYNGPQAVLTHVFTRLGTEWDGYTVAPEEFVGGGDTVVVLGTYSGTYKATEKSFQAPFAHAWNLRGGKVARFRQYTDTVLVQEALKGS